jgi:Protein of unknown function (DUF4013)
MSDAAIATPPPPPPPPPQPAFDFVRPFAFVFEDARWVTKVLIGGLFQIAAFVLIGIPFLLGYMAQLARNAINGVTTPLPEWDDLGEFFAEGLRLLGVGICYVLPFYALLGMMFVPMIGLSMMHGERDVPPAFGGAFSCVWCLIMPLSLAYMIWMPAALLFAVVERRFGAAFEFRRIYDFIRNNVGNYLLAIVVTFVARFASGFGIILFCIGIVFTVFWALCVSVYAFAQTWRLAKQP